jgi:universal stress protein E
MKRFKKILVGVDLSSRASLVSEELSAPNAEAVRQAIWLAKLNSATVDFLFSLDLSVTAQQLISESATDESTILNEAKGRLAELVAKAREEGVVADSHVVIGKSWLELIRQVLRARHDLVVVGTRHLGAIQGFLLGSTGIKLLRKCPCPVWVTQSPVDEEMGSILVAHDLRPVGDLAMELGCSMAKLRNAKLHVVHAAEFPEFDYMFPAAVSAEHKQAYRREADAHIQAQLAAADLPQPAQIHFVIEPPDFAIMNCVEQHDVDLIVMGTVGRAGISGFITGNTAERLLPRIPCSLLAVKPPGFESPVTLD